MPRNTDVGYMSRLSLQKLCNENPDIKCKGFAGALRKLEEKYGMEDNVASVDRVIPDAYWIDEKTCTIHIYEIEDSHSLEPYKLSRLIMLWFYYDCENWEFKVHIINRYGKEIQELELGALYAAQLVDDIKHNQEEK